MASAPTITDTIAAAGGDDAPPAGDPGTARKGTASTRRGNRARFQEGIPDDQDRFLFRSPCSASPRAWPHAGRGRGSRPGFTINGGATLVLRLPLPRHLADRPALRRPGHLHLGHKSGFYATIWGSSIDDYVAAGRRPGDRPDRRLPAHAAAAPRSISACSIIIIPRRIAHGDDSDFVEPYVSIAQAFGPVTAKATANYAPSQSALSIGDRQ